MKRTRFSDMPCSIARTMDILGDWWTPLVMREASYGAVRFEDFCDGLGISRNVLTQRLNRLVDEGLLKRVPYQDRPVRHEYRLTDKGRQFLDVLMAVMRWGDDWQAGPEGVPIELFDTRTGDRVRPRVVDESTGESLDLRFVKPRLGPGYPPGDAARTLAIAEKRANRKRERETAKRAVEK